MSRRNIALGSPTLLKYLQTTRENSVQQRAPQEKSIYVHAGRGITLEDLQESGPSGISTRPAKRGRGSQRLCKSYQFF